MKRWIGIFSVLLFSGAYSASLHAQEPMRPYEEHAKRIDAAGKVGPLGSDLFGDQISLYNGATEFSVVDIDLPGNGPPMQLRRRFKVETKKGGEILGGFGAWDLDVPYLHGTFDSVHKWNESARGPALSRRCTDFWLPKYDLSIRRNEIFTGIHMYVPGQGDREQLRLPNLLSDRPPGAQPPYPNHPEQVPADGETYRWAARDNIRFRCKDTLPGYTGEGFVAVDAQGTQYSFDLGIERGAGEIITLDNARFGRVRVYLMASHVEDRHGNWVKYHYDGQGRLDRIESKDGRLIDLHYLGNSKRVDRATANGREWRYFYDTNYLGLPDAKLLRQVTLQGESIWTYQYTGGLVPHYPDPDAFLHASCALLPEVAFDTFKLAVTHHAGATGEFDFSYTRHGRNGVHQNMCQPVNPQVPEAGLPWAWATVVPNYFDLYSLTTKTITALQGNAPSIWRYGYDYDETASALTIQATPCLSCTQSKTTTLTQPDGAREEHIFGVVHEYNDGQLLRSRVLQPSTNQPPGQPPVWTLLRESTTDYVFFDQRVAGVGGHPLAWTYPFAEMIGLNPAGDDPSGMYNRPPFRTTVWQQGVLFTSLIDEFDEFARPQRVIKSNDLSKTNTKTERSEYEDNFALWALGQLLWVQDESTGRYPVLLDYDDSASLASLTRFGRFEQSYTYNDDGSLNTVTDGRQNQVTLENYFRGIPRTIRWASGVEQKVVVDDRGQITSATDVLRNTTGYTYDDFGRLRTIVPPALDTQSWNTTTIDYIRSSGEYGIPSGLLQQITTTGNHRKITHLDGRLRPVLTHEYDLGHLTQGHRFVVRQFDHDSRETFVSYPVSNLSNLSEVSVGSRSVYDALSRPIRSEQDGELAQPLLTRIEYLPDFRKRVTNPREFVTTYGYQIFDQPDDRAPTLIEQPGGINTRIDRDVFGKPDLIERYGVYEGAPISEERRFVYDTQQLLCKRIDPEAGATIFAYDAAGNIAWSTEGSTRTSAICDRDLVPLKHRTVRSYDVVNRLLSVTFPDDSQNLSFIYAADGKIDLASAGNVSTRYLYNARRLPTSESLTVDGRRFVMHYSYDGNAVASGLTYPDGTAMNFAPNGLGQPTQSGAYASGAHYWPNGELAGFQYGNGIDYVSDQNDRKLLGNFSYVHSKTAATLLSQDLFYDANANLVRMDDLADGALRDRAMEYDAADRLTLARADGLWGQEGFQYDALDNIRRVTRGPQVRNYVYDASNKLTSINVNGSAIHSLGYDERGNVNARNGQAISFDVANRLRSFGSTAQYAYDAHGRRVKRDEGGVATYFVYSVGAQLLYELNAGNLQYTRHHYLGGRSIARASGTLERLSAPRLSVPATSTGNYTVSWSAVIGATGYLLEEKIDNGVWGAALRVEETEWRLRNRPNGIYRYRARSCNDAGVCSAHSAEVSVTVGPVVPIGVPILTVPAQSTTGNYSVNWSQVTGATRYLLEEQQGVSTATVYDGPALTFALSGRAPGSYGYRVSACNLSDCGAWSEVKTVQVIAAFAITVSGESATGTFTLSWPTISGATSYQLEESSDGGNSWTTYQFNAATNWSPQPAKSAGVYRYRVRACISPCAAPSEVVVVTVLGTSTLTLPAHDADGNFSAAWTSVTQATAYRLEESSDGGATFVIRQDSSATTWSTPAALVAGRYIYRVKACLTNGCGLASATQTILVIATPVLTVSVPSNGSYSVSWTSVPFATHYELQESVNGGGWTILQNSAALSHAIIGRPAGSYSYRVRACHTISCGAYSAVATVTVPAVPAVPTGLTALGGPLHCNVSWNPSSTATRYELRNHLLQVLYSGAQVSFNNSAAPCSAGYSVRACNANGCSAWSGEVQPAVPPTPTLNAPASSTTGNYDLTWNATTGAAGFPLEEQVNGGTWVTLQSTSSTFYGVSGRAPGSYGYRVRACNITGCSAYSGVATVVVTAVPPPLVPTGLVITGGASNCTVTWNPSSGATRYELRDHQQIEVYNGALTSFNFDAQCSASYSVRACNAACSLWSNEAQPALPAPPTLTVPGSNTSGSYSITWALPPGATRVEVEESVNDGPWTPIYSGPGISHAVSGKAPGSYRYRARACNAAGCSAFSPIVTVEVRPPAPNLSVPPNNATGSYTVSWSIVSSATRYELDERVNSGSWMLIQNSPETSRWLSGKTANNYSYRVRACASSLCSANSSIGTVVVLPPPPVPTGLVISGGASHCNVTWNTSSTATSYELRDHLGQLAYSGAQASFFFDAQCASSYSVRACNASGCSAWSNGVETPLIPPLLIAPENNTTGSYEVVWDIVNGATRYELEERINGGSFVLIQNNAGTIRSFSGKAPGSYGYRARSCNSVSCSGYSATATVIVVALPTPGLTMPTSNTTGSYTVLWNAISGATRYELEQRANAGTWTLIQNTTETSRFISGMSPGIYDYRVRACNAAGCSNYSEWGTITVTSVLPPPVPTGLSASGGASHCNVLWNASSGATRYDLRNQFQFEVYSGTQTSFNSDAQCDQSYSVRACNAGACSEWSNPIGPSSINVTAHLATGSNP